MNLVPRIANYIARYAPSHARLFAYLEKKKCQNPALLIGELGYHEELMCDMWMRTFINLGTSERDIRVKLMKKEFPKHLIQDMIGRYASVLRDYDEYRGNIESQIRTLSDRGKSRSVIAVTLIGKYPYFRDEIRELLEGVSDGSNLIREYEKYRTRYDLHIPHDREKLIAALLRKGFSYSEIREVLPKAK